VKDREIRTAILALAARGHGKRAIAKACSVSRNTVREVLKLGTSDVPHPDRPEALAAHEETIRTLYETCGGNRIRVFESLREMGVTVPYQTLTGFLRRRGIGVALQRIAGHYTFAPGEEMQHDTSPHDVLVGEKKRRLQCASLVLGHSRMVYAQCYLSFTRFHAKAFLTGAFRFLGGCARRCMIDNTSVVLACGSGKNALVAPEMEAFAERFGFEFAAHAIGDANRKGKVERSFSYIEGNFYPGRTFTDLADLNAQLLAWCKAVNAKPRRHLHASPVELFRSESAHLVPLPLHVPEVYALHRRVVAVEAMVTLHNNRYSVPAEWIGKTVEVRETVERVVICSGHELLAEHPCLEEKAGGQSVLPAHRPAGHRYHKKGAGLPAMPEIAVLSAGAPELAAMVLLQKSRGGKRAVRLIRHLHRMYLDYPPEPLIRAVRTALEHGLYDVERIERMVLRAIGGEFFRMKIEGEDDE
jgi:transposase